MTGIRLQIAHTDFPATSGDEAMRDTNTDLYNVFGASLVAAAVHLCAMPDTDTNPSLYGSIGASLMAAAAAFRLRTMCDTNSALLSLFGASLLAAAFPLL
jgi:hypothetical protein